LPWYVRRDDGEVVQDLRAELDEARALNVRQVAGAAEVARPALTHAHPDARHGPWTHEQRIAHWVKELEQADELDLDAPAWRTPEGPVLRDRCHRACALYRLAPADWSLTLLVGQPPPGESDAAPGLRR
jgi:hypothetical protein